MSRYALKDDCHGRNAKKGQRVNLGWSYTHGLEAYNWVVGFSDKNNLLVYVPEGSKLIGPDNKEYELSLDKIGKQWEHLDQSDYMAYLNGKEKRFGLNTDVKISLDHAMMLRFEKFVPKFRIKEIGGQSVELENKNKISIKGLLKKVLNCA